MARDFSVGLASGLLSMSRSSWAEDSFALNSGMLLDLSALFVYFMNKGFINHSHNLIKLLRY